MRSKTVLIILGLTTVVFIAYLVMTKEQRSAKKANEQAIRDSLEMLWQIRQDSIQESMAEIERASLKKDFLEEISGVYQESVLGNKIILDLKGDNKTYVDGSITWKLTLKSIDLENEVIRISALYGDAKNPHDMHITRMISVKQSPLRVDTDISNFPWELYWIRPLD